MALKIKQGFQLENSQPNFVRDIFSTIAEMKAFKGTKLPPMYVASCVEDGGLYVFNKTNAEDEKTGKWRKVYMASDVDAKIAATEEKVAAAETKAAEASAKITGLETKVAALEKGSSSGSDTKTETGGDSGNTTGPSTENPSGGGETKTDPSIENPSGGGGGTTVDDGTFYVYHGQISTTNELAVEDTVEGEKVVSDAVTEEAVKALAAVKTSDVALGEVTFTDTGKIEFMAYAYPKEKGTITQVIGPLGSNDINDTFYQKEITVDGVAYTVIHAQNAIDTDGDAGQTIKYTFKQ